MVLTPFVMMPLLTQANLLNRPVQEVTTTFTEGTNMAAAPSPDGETIILAIQGSLWSIRSSGGDAKRLTGWQVEATWPVWAPDGSRIAFQNYSDNTYHIWTMAPDGSDLRQVTSGLYDHREPAWSPDGRMIAFSSDRSGNGSYDIWTIDLATGAYERRTSMTTGEHSPLHGRRTGLESPTVMAASCLPSMRPDSGKCWRASPVGPCKRPRGSLTARA